MNNYEKVKESAHYILYTKTSPNSDNVKFVIFNKQTKKIIKGETSKQIYTLFLDPLKFKEKYMKQK